MNMKRSKAIRDIQKVLDYLRNAPDCEINRGNVFAFATNILMLLDDEN